MYPSQFRGVKFSRAREEGKIHSRKVIERKDNSPGVDVADRLYVWTGECIRGRKSEVQSLKLCADPVGRRCNVETRRCDPTTTTVLFRKLIVSSEEFYILFDNAYIYTLLRRGDGSVGKFCILGVIGFKSIGITC